MKINFHPYGRTPKTQLSIDKDLTHEQILDLAENIDAQWEFLGVTHDSLLWDDLCIDKVKIVRPENGVPVSTDGVSDTKRHIISYTFDKTVRNIVLVLPESVTKADIVKKVATFFSISENAVEVTSKLQSR